MTTANTTRLSLPCSSAGVRWLTVGPVECRVGVAPQFGLAGSGRSPMLRRLRFFDVLMVLALVLRAAPGLLGAGGRGGGG